MTTRAGETLFGRRVVVVGAGLAGLSAALGCADLGAQVTVLERQRRLGGLTWSFSRNGVVMDNGQHVFLACCSAYLGFLHRIGAANDVVAPRPLDVPVVAPGAAGPVIGRLRRQDLPVPLHLAATLLRYRHLSLAHRLALGRVLAALYRLDLEDPRLDDVTFGSWLSAQGQSEAAIAAVWDLITVPTVNLPASEVSLAVAAMVFKTGLLSSREASDIGWSAVPLGHLHGERAATALLQAGVSVHLGTRVTGVEEVDGAGWRILTGSGELHADAVVVAVPHEESAAMVPQWVDGRMRWSELGSSAIVDVHLIFDRRVTEWPIMAAHRSPVQWVFDRTASSGLQPSGRQYLAVSLSAADQLLGRAPEELRDSSVAALERLLPPVSEARLVDATVTKERRATFRAAPGSQSVRPPAATRRAGLVLAGAWTETGWPATMEGAVRSGSAAVQALVDAAARHELAPIPIIPRAHPKEVA
jgi:squalene-associated FAD-dependent desaturase